MLIVPVTIKAIPDTFQRKMYTEKNYVGCRNGRVSIDCSVETILPTITSYQVRKSSADNLKFRHRTK